MGSAPLKGKSSHDPNGHEDETAPTSPRGSEPCENGGVFQAGGHGKLSKDPLLEGVIRKPANDAEIVFYQTLNGDDAQLSTVPTHIRAFFPQFHGVSDKKFVLLQDLTHNLKKACVMDIKMGTKTYTSDSNVLKQWMLEHKDGKTTTQALGFRITGFRTFKKTTNEYDVKGKPWGMALRPDDVAENLVTFFDDGTTIRLDVVQKFIDRLEVLFPWYSLQNIIKIYSSSLLFVYDSEGPADSAEVHMIDFAHVKRIEDPEERDHGYIAGLRNLIDIFKQIRDTNLGAPGSIIPTTPNKTPSSPRSATPSSHTKSTDAVASPPHPNTNPPHLDLPVSAEKPKRKRHGSNAAHSAAAPIEDDAATTGDKNGHTGRSSIDGEAKTPKSPRSHKTPKSPRTPSSTASEDPASARSGDTHVLVLDLGPDTTTLTKEKRKSAKRRKAHKETEGVIYGEAARDDRESEPVEKI